MQEAVVHDWVSRLAEQHPDAFRGLPPAPEGPGPQPAASHESRTYLVRDTRVHVKFFRRTLGRTSVTYDPCREMRAEYDTLREFEKNGFGAGRHRIVRALGTNAGLDCALATAYAPGDTVLALIERTLKGGGDEEELLHALDLTAGLLKKIHTVMPQSPNINGADTFYAYLKPVLYLEEMDALEGCHRRIIKGLSAWYRAKPLFEQRGVTVHGDANPSNFKIYKGVIYGFDVERSRPGRSPLLDAGTMVAELLHHCVHLTGDEGLAAPYIGRFLKAYAPAREERKQVDALLPFYVSRSLLKIAMLGYWKRDYRRRLVEMGARRLEAAP